MTKPALTEVIGRARYLAPLLQLVATTLAASATAQSNAPVQVLPRTILTSPSPTYLKNKFFVPPAPGATAILQSPLPTTSFAARFGAGVPDTHGVVGKDQITTLLNPGYNVQARSGSSIVTNSLRNFWDVTNSPVGDPLPGYHRAEAALGGFSLRQRTGTDEPKAMLLLMCRRG